MPRDPSRRARIRVHSRSGRRGGLPSASRELAWLRRVFGPSIPLAPKLEAELWLRRLDEIDSDLERAEGETAEDLHEERAKVVSRLADLGCEAPTRQPAPPEEPSLASYVGPEPTVIVSVGEQHLGGRRP